MSDKEPKETNNEPVIDEPVLDGATDEAPNVDPRKGDDDPGLVRDLDTHEPTVNPYG